MDFLSLAQRRQSCRNFDPSREVESEKLETILAAALLAPSAKNRQPYEIFVAKGEKAKAHGWMLLSFLAGAFLASVMCGFMGVRAIWCTLLPLGIVFADLLRADLTDERGLLDVTPHGHQ